MTTAGGTSHDDARAGRNLALILSAWSAIATAGSTAELGAILHEDVVWQGALPDSLSRGRDEVLAVLADNEAPRLTRLEAQALGDRVLLTMESPDFPVTDGHEPALRCLIYTFRDGLVVRIQTLGKRDFAVD